MIRKIRAAATLLMVMAVPVASLPASTTGESNPPFGNAIFEATLTYTEEAAVKIRTPDHPNDKDDTNFSVRINGNFRRVVQMTHDGEGMTVAECMEWDPNGGCKTYTPLSFGGSVVYHIEHTMHTENLPQDLPDVYTDHSVGDFSGALQEPTGLAMTEVDLGSVGFDLTAGMKGHCDGTISHVYSTMDNGSVPPRQVSHTQNSEVKKCSEDWVHAAYEPSDVSGVKADGTDAPENREIRINVTACNVNPDACAQGNLGEAGAIVIATGNDWYGAVASGNMQQGYKLHFEQPRDISKYMLKGADGTWKRNMTVDAKITPTAKTGRPGLASTIAPRPDIDRLSTRKPTISREPEKS